MLYSGKSEVKRDTALTSALKIFLSFLLVFSMIPAGISLQSFAQDSNDAAQEAVNDSSAAVSGDATSNSGDGSSVDSSGSENGISSADGSTGSENSGDNESDSNSSISDDNSSNNNNEATDESDEIAPLILPTVQAVGTTIYWSPTAEDIKSGDTVVAKAGNDKFDGSGRNSAVLTWERVVEIMKEEYNSVTIYLLAPIQPGLVQGDSTFPDSMELDGRSDGIRRNVTMYTVGAAATSAVDVKSGKTISLKNINIDVTDTSSSMAQQSISVEAANETSEGGRLVIGQNVNISGRIIVDLDDTGKSTETVDGERIIKNPIKLDAVPFSQGSIDVYFKNLNIDDYLGGVTLINSTSVENLKNYFTLNTINQNEGFKFVYKNELEIETDQSQWDTKVLRAYKKQEVGTIYVDNTNGSDDNTGLTHNSPVQTMSKAKELLTSAPWIDSVTTRIIALCSTYTITDVQTWDFSDVTLPSGVTAEVRFCDQNGIDGGHSLFNSLVKVDTGGSLTLKGITLRVNVDIDKTTHDSRAITVNGGGTLTLQTGAKVTGGVGTNLTTQAPGYGIYISNTTANQTTLNMEDGSEVSYFSRGIHMIASNYGNSSNTSFNFNGGLITQNSNYTYRLPDEPKTSSTNTSTWGGGGARLSRVTFNMNGTATVSHNESLQRFYSSTNFVGSTGSGICALDNSIVTVNNGSIVDNVPRKVTCYSSSFCYSWMGAGLFVNGSSLTINDGKFERNSVENTCSHRPGSGAAVYFYRSSSSNSGNGFMRINGGYFNNNKGNQGSAIYAYDSYGSLSANDFHIAGDENNKISVSNNTMIRHSTGSYGSVYLYGGSPKIENVDFSNNTNNGSSSNVNYGAGLYVYAYKGYSQYSDMGNVIVKNCKFNNNAITGTSSSSAYGAGLYLRMSSSSLSDKSITSSYNAQIEDCSFSGNSISDYSTSRGGAIYILNGNSYASVRLKNNVFDGNSAKDGGAIASYGGAKNSSDDYWTNSTILDSNNTFTNNTARSENGGEHIYATGSVTLYGASFSSSGTALKPAIDFVSDGSSRRLSVKSSGVSLSGCYGAYLGTIDSYVSSLDDETSVKSFPINSKYVNVPLLKGADNIKIDNADHTDLDVYNIDDVSTSAYVSATNGAISSENELVGYNKCVYVQKKAEGASDGIYIDGVNGNDDNSGLTALSAVKTLPKAKERLKDKISEANTNGTTFNPYIIVAGKVTLSENTDVTLTADEIGTQATKAYDSIPSTYTLPAEDKEFFPMFIPSETLNDAMFDVNGSGITVNFNNVYFDGRSKTLENSGYIGLRVSSGTANVNGTSRFVNFRRYVLRSSGSSAILNLKDNTFVGYSGHVTSNNYYNIEAIYSSTCNITDNVRIERSNPRYTDNISTIYGFGVYASNATVNIKGNATISSAKSGIAFDGSSYYCSAIYAYNSATINLGDSDADTSSNHARVIPGSNSLGIASMGAKVNVYGYASIGNSSGNKGYGISCVGSTTASTIKFFNNASMSYLREGFHTSTRGSSYANVELDDNSSVRNCQYGLFNETYYYSNNNGIINFNMNGTSSIVCSYGINVSYGRSDTTGGVCVNLTMADNSLISTTYVSYVIQTAKSPKIIVKDNASITSSGSDAIYCYGGSYGNQNIGDITIQDNAVLKSASTRYSIYVSTSTGSNYTNNASVEVKGNASVSSIYFLPNNNNQKVSISESATVTKSSGLDYAVVTNKIASVDMTSSISGDIRLTNEGYVLINDKTSIGTQGEKFSLSLAESKRGTRVIGPGENVSNAQDYKSTFKTETGFDLSNGTGNYANWLVLDSDNNVYMSNTGSDSNSGRSTNSPVRTFKKAKEVMKTLDSGANFRISGQMYPVKAGELEWSLDDGGTFTNDKGETWKPYIDIASDFSSGNTWIYVTNMKSNNVMKFKNLNFTHSDDSTKLSSSLIYGYSTSSTTTDRNIPGSKIEVDGCVFEDIKAQSNFSCISTYVATDLNNTVIRNIDNQTLNSYGLIQCWNTSSSDLTELNLNSVEMSNNTFRCNYGYDPMSLAALIDAPCIVSIANSKFNNNTVSRTGSYATNGSLLSFRTETSNVQISNSEFRGNSYSNASGTRLVYGMCLYSQGSLSMRGTTFDSNTSSNASSQGVIYFNGANNSLTNCTITNNHSGIYATSSANVAITGGEISNNAMMGTAPYSSYLYNLTLSNNAILSDTFYISNPITLASIITNPNIHYTVALSTTTPGRVLVQPDGKNVVSAESYTSFFSLLDTYQAELGKSENNIVLMKPIYIAGTDAKDSNDGLKPTTSVATWAGAQAVAKKSQAQGKYINYYICGKYSSGVTPETWDLDGTRTSDGKLSSFVYRYNGQKVPGYPDLKCDANTGDLFDIKSGQTFTFSNITLTGTGDSSSCGTVFNVQSGGKLIITSNASIKSAEDIDSNATSAIANNAGTITINENAVVDGSNTASICAIYQNGEINLANTPKISGAIRLIGSGSGASDNKYINVAADTKGYGGSGINVVVGGAYGGRVVLKYPENYTPTATDMAAFAFDDSTSASYQIGSNPDQKNEIILTSKNVVYLDSANGNDSKNGLSPDDAKKTLTGAWDAMNAKAQATGKGGGVIYLVSTLEISEKVEIRNQPSSGDSELSYLKINDGESKSTEGYVSFRRYSQPTAHDRLTGYTKTTNTSHLIHVASSGNLSLINSVNIDGHGNDLEGTEDVTAKGVTISGNTLRCEGSINLNASSIIHSKQTGGWSAMTIYNAQSTIRNASIDYENANVTESQEVGALSVFGSNVNIYTSTFNSSNSSSVDPYSLVYYSNNGDSATVTLNGVNSFNGAILERDSSSKLQFANVNTRNVVDGEDAPFKIRVLNPVKGWEVVKYLADEAPETALEINEKVQPLGDTFNTYNIVRNTNDAQSLILDYYQPIFVNGNDSSTGGGSDDNDGLTADTPVKSLRAAYTKAKEQNAGYIVFVGQTTFNNDTTYNISNMQYSDSASSSTVNLFRPVEFVRYVKPSSTISGFTTDSYNQNMLSLTDAAIVNIGELTISGNYATRTGNIADSMKSASYPANFPMISVASGTTLNINDGAKLYDSKVTPASGWTYDSDVISNNGDLNIGAASILQADANDGSAFAINHQGTSLKLNDANNSVVDRIYLKSTTSGQTTTYPYITVPVELDSTTTIKVSANDYKRDRDVAVATYANPDFTEFAKHFSFPSGAVPSTLSLKKKYGTTNMLALEDYSDITITKTWKKTSATKSEHPDNIQLKVTAAGSGDNISETINVSVPTSGEATATHGTVASTTTSGEDIWTITLKDMPTYSSFGTSSSKLAYTLEETQVGGQTPDAAKWKPTVSSATTQGTFTLTNTKQHVLSYDKNSADAIGKTPDSQTLNYGVTVAADAATSLTRTGYTLIGWNTSADGSGTHYNPSENIFIGSDITLYAMWAKVEIEIVNSDALGQTIARGQTATVKYSVTSPETTTVLGNFKFVVNYAAGYDPSGSSSPTGGIVNTGSKTITWTNPSIASGVTTFTVTYKALTEISLNDKDSLPLSATATFDNSKTVTTSDNLPVTDAFHITYDVNGATSGTAPVDSKFYWAKTDSTKNATILGGSELKKVSGGKTYTFVGWNESSDGTGTHHNAADTVDMAAKAKDITLYAQWGEAEYDVSLEYNKAKVRRGETITYTIKINLPEGSDTTVPLKVEMPVPVNTTFVSADKSGTASGGKITWSITNAQIGENTVSAKVKVNTDFAVNNAGNIVATAKVTHKTSNIIEASTTTEITKSYRIIYDISDADSGTAPVDNTYYSVDYDSPKAKGSDTFTYNTKTFVGWNTKADGTGTHYWNDATIKLDSSLTSDITLYAKSVGGDYSYTTEFNKDKIRRGETVTFTATASIPEVLTTGTYTFNYSIPTGMSFVSVVSKDATDTITNTSGNITQTVAAGKVQGDHKLVFKLKADTDSSFNLRSELSSVMSFSYSGKTLRTTEKMTVTPSYKISYDVNTGSGTAPTDDNYYAPEYDSSYVTKAPGNISKTGYAFVGWNTVAAGTGTHQNRNATVSTTATATKLSADLTYYAQWSKVETTYAISTAKQKAKPIDNITFTYAYTLPESRATAASDITFTVTIPTNTTLVDKSTNGVYSAANKTVTYTIPADAKAGVVNLTLTVKVDSNVTELGLKQISSSGTATYAGETFNSTTAIVPLTDAYQVKYDGNGATGGTAPADTRFYSLELGEQATVQGQSTLKRTGYMFYGWNTKADGSGVHFDMSDKFTPVKSTQTLYAMWASFDTTWTIEGGKQKAYRGREITFTETFKLPETSSVMKNNIVLRLPIYEGTSYVEGSLVSPIGTADFSNKNRISITASIWDKSEYSITYKLKCNTDKSFNDYSTSGIEDSHILSYDGGTYQTRIGMLVDVTKAYAITYDGNSQDAGVAPVDKTYYAPEFSDVATVLGNVGEPALQKSGYSFSGWNTEMSGTGTTYAAGNEFSTFTDDIKLYAQWAKADITSTNELGHDKARRGETISYVATIDVPSPTTTLGLSVTLPDSITPVAGSCEPADTVNISGQTITWSNLTAQKGTFAFKFAAKVSEDKSINDLKSINVIPEFSNNGNEFTVERDVDITRSFKAAFDVNGGDGDVYFEPDITYVSPEYGEKLTLPTDKDADGRTSVTKAGYTFNGFNTNKNASGTHFDAASSTTLSDDLDLFVEWKANVYTIKFDKNADDAKGEMNGISATYDKAINLPSNKFTREKFGFVGWANDADSQEPDYINGQNVSNLTEINGGEVVLYAVWSDDFKTIKFETNGGSAIDDMNVINTKTATKPTDPVRRGYKFAGWFSDEGLSSEFDFATPITEDITLYAKWTPITYIVHYIGNGATSGSDVTDTLTYDQEYTINANFERKNYTFKEWNTSLDASGTRYVGTDDDLMSAVIKNLADTQDAEISLYAIWEAGSYTIHFDKNADDAKGEMSDVVVKYDEKTKLPTNKFTNVEYAFAGWTTDKNSKQAKYADEMKVSELADAGHTVTLYAIWTNNYHVVEFDSNGGSAVKSQNVESGNKAVRPDDPQYTGHKLVNWLKDDVAYDFDTPVLADTTLKAEWEVTDYTIHFDINGGNGGNMGDISVKYNQDVALPANTFTRTGYTFKGWNTKSDGSGNTYKDKQNIRNLTDADGGDVTLYAVWEANPYSVKFDANGGEGVMANQSFVYDSEQKLSTNEFAKTGFFFVGWSTSNVSTYANASAITYKDGAIVKNLTDKRGETVVLYAIWSDNAHSVTFDSNGGTKVNNAYVIDGDTVNKPADPKKRGYTFAGWMLDDEAYDFEEPVTTDITLTAKWIANSYSIAFDGNGATSGYMADLAMTYNTPGNLTTNSYARTGYTFLGWNTEASGTGTDFKDGESVRNLTDEPGATVVLYAKWQASNYSVKFDANGGTGVMPNQTFTFDVEAALTANRFTKTGELFIGWNTEMSGTGTKYIDGAVVKNLSSSENETVTLYAQWADKSEVKTITFDSNGGSEVLRQNVKTGDVTVKPANPSKAGYAFVGWFDESDTEFEFGKTLSEDITLTAKWTANKYSIKFDRNGGQGTMDDQTFTFDEAGILSKNTFTKAGYTFSEWEAEIDGETVTYADEAEILNLTDEPNAVVTFKATWTANSYTVKFDANEGTGVMDDQTFIYDTEDKLNPNKFERGGYVFGGWNTAKDGSGTSYLNGDRVKNVAGEASEVTLYATWIEEASAVAVEFDTDGGSEVLTQYVKRGSKLQQPAYPSKLGYTFLGWFNGEDEYDFDTPVTNSIKLTAKWIANTYTVEFADNGSNDGVMEPMTFTYDVPRKLEKNAYSKDNYHFIGWKLTGGSVDVVTYADALDDELIADEAEVMNLTPEQNGQVTLTAVWEADVFAIHYFNVEGATNNNPSTYTFGEGVEALQDAYKPGFTFDGWYEGPALTGEVVTSISAESVGEVSLYAKWTEIPSGPVNPLIPSWIKRLIAGTGDSLPFYVGGAVLILLVSGGAIYVLTRRRRHDQTN